MSDSESSPSGFSHTTPIPWTFWAKWSRGSKTAGSYHPVLCHLVDVAMVTEALWQRVLPWRWKERFAARLDLDIASAERWVVFWAGLHDLGKVCPGFQLQLHQTNPIAHELVVERLKDHGLPWRQVDWIAHGAVSARALCTILPQQYGFSKGVADAVAVAIGGHHGRFQSYTTLKNLSSDSVGDGPWHSARISTAAWLAKAVSLPHSPSVATLDHPTAMALAGLVSVADWIGSSETFFTHGAPDARRVPTLDLGTYRDYARAQANTALNTLGWTGWTPSGDQRTFQQLFPGISEPRPLQEATIEIAEILRGPAIVVIESPMGEGKTEAAMYLADHWSVTIGQRGIYFALPTQATSNGMFERVYDFLKRRYPDDVVNLQLLHGHAVLSQTLKELHERWQGLLTPENVYTGKTLDEINKGEVVAAEWFSAGKRALLAPFGVGTVDQALLAALQIMHVFVRLYGLSTKTVIVDEVHAYDAYMSTLLERLLAWLGAFEAPVVLLSATLPRKRRERLIAAYAKGAAWDTFLPTTDAHYPRITWASAAGCDARQTAVSALNRRTAHIEWLSGAIPEPGTTEQFRLGERLSALLANGGCAAVICNTVSRAQRVYQALKPYFAGNSSDGEHMLDLFHARYPHEMRAEREMRVLERFGNKKDAKRPDQAVVVATQVIEQSLDLDFDVMVTDLAPADLVLQRMGRLHRHVRSRPLGLSTPLLIIMQPYEDADGVPTFERGDEAVYDPHILLRSYLELRGRSTLTVPNDIEPLVEAVYGDAHCPEDATPALRVRWDDTLDALDLARANEEQQAQNRYIKPPALEGPLFQIVTDPREEEAPELRPAFQALTRLAEESVSVVCLAGTDVHPLLRPGGPPITLRHKPTPHEVEALLHRSVNLSDKRVVRSLIERKTPPHWDETPLLRNHHPLYFDAQGVVPLGKWRIRLDTDLGIVIE